MTAGSIQRRRRRLRMVWGTAGLATAVVIASCTSAGESAVRAPAGGSAAAGMPAPASVYGTQEPTAAPQAPSTASGVTRGTTTAPPTTVSPPASSAPVAPVKVVTPHVIWSSAAPRPLGQPVALGKDQLVLYVVGIDTVPYIQVMDARTGKVRWRAPASVAGGSSGTTIQPAVVAGKVVYVRPDYDSAGSGRLVVADPLTGKVLSLAKDSLFITEHLHACGTQVCFSGESSDDDKIRRYKVDVPSGRSTVDTTRLVAGATDIGLEGLQTVRADGQPDVLLRRSNGRTVWQRPLADVFGAGHSAGNEWRFEEIGTSGIIVAQVDWARDAPVFTEDLAKNRRVVAFDVKTGKTLWSQTGTDRVCLPNGNYGGGDDPLDLLRCRWAPGSSLRVDGAQRTIIRGSVSIERFDPKTGRTVWSSPLADPAGRTWDAWTATFGLAAGHTLIVSAPTGRTVLDMATGKATPARPDAQSVCEQWVTSPIWNGGYTDNGAPRNVYYTGLSYTTCDLAGRPVAAQQPWPSWAGLDIAGMHVVTTPQGIIGTRMMAGPDPKPVRATAAAVVGPVVAPQPAVTVGRPVLAWTSAADGDRFLTQPVPAGKVAVLYARHNGELTLEGVAPATGRILWRQRASAGSFGLFDAIPPTVVGDRVLYPRTGPGGDDPGIVMVVADAATGRDVHVSGNAYYLRDWPRVCGAQACFTSYNSDGMYALRVDMATGFIALDPPVDAAAQTPIGADLVRSAGPTAEVTIAAIDTSVLRFQVPAGSLVPAGFTTYRGSFDFWPDSGVYVGEFAQDLAPPTPTVFAVGAKAPMVGVDARTGKKLWATTGTDTSCLPFALRSSPRYPVRCRWSKSSTQVYANGTWSYRNADVSLEGFSPGTGATTWSVPLRHPTGEVTVDAVASGDRTVIEPGPTGPILIDLQTGRTSPISSSQARYCPTGITSPLGLKRTINGTEQPDLWGTGTTWDQCDSAKAAVPATGGWPSWIGAQVGGMRLVLTGKGLQGFRQK